MKNKALEDIKVMRDGLEEIRQDLQQIREIANEMSERLEPEYKYVTHSLDDLVKNSGLTEDEFLSSMQTLMAAGSIEGFILKDGKITIKVDKDAELKLFLMDELGESHE